MPKFSFGGGTHVGKKRKHNEDCYGADSSVGFWVVADGMGGAKGGEVASSIAVNEILSCIKLNIPLTQSILTAHQAIINSASKNKDLKGMGSTVVALKCNTNTEYEIAWVGDSRAYLWSDRLSRLTEDHSYVQQLVHSGELDPDDTWGHIKSNVIVQALGMVNKDIEVGVYSGQWRDNQKILLCSDGLHGELKDSEIADIVRQDKSNQQIADLLITAALSKGGKDNISVILVSPVNTVSSPTDHHDETIPYGETLITPKASNQTIQMTSADSSSAKTTIATTTATTTTATTTATTKKTNTNLLILVSIITLGVLVCLLSLA